MNPRQFLQIGGVVLVLIGVLGFVGVIGPHAHDSVFGETWWFDNGENVAHTVLGIAGVAASFVLPARLQRALVLVLGAVGIFFGIYNMFTEQFPGTNLESPADMLLHLAVGTWALLAAIYGPRLERRREPATPVA